MVANEVETEVILHDRVFIILRSHICTRNFFFSRMRGLVGRARLGHSAWCLFLLKFCAVKHNMFILVRLFARVCLSVCLSVYLSVCLCFTFSCEARYL